MKVQWIKITTNIFDDEKIQIIESMPDGDSIIVIWFKILALAGKSNNGGLIMLSEKIPYTEEMLITIFRRKQTVIKLALDTFIKLDMIEKLDNDTLLITNWEKHQNTDKLLEIREGQRKRQKEYRDRKKKQLKLNNTLHNELHNCNNIEKEVEKEQETEKENNKINYIDIVDYLNSKIDSKYKSSTKITQDMIKARFNEGFTYDDFKKVIDIKSKEWLNTDMAIYLRPKTLFSNKFESYLNQKEITVKPKNDIIHPEWIDQYEIDLKNRKQEQHDDVDLEELQESIKRL